MKIVYLITFIIFGASVIHLTGCAAVTKPTHPYDVAWCDCYTTEPSKIEDFVTGQEEFEIISMKTTCKDGYRCL